MSDIELYSQYFTVGQKVGVGIPLPNADVFRDWAIIHNIEEDLVSLQLSRDILPVNVSLRYGQILELRGGVENNGYCCRAIVVSEGYDRELLLRLIGEIVSDELREFYRIDAFLPIIYYVSHEQDIDRLRHQWEEQRARRQHQGEDTIEHGWISGIPPAGAELPHERYHSASKSAVGEMDSDSDPGDLEDSGSWDSIIPLAANISGGGLRIITHQGFEYGEYMLIQMLVPTPQRMIDIVGRVVFANLNPAAGRDHEYYNTGVQFVYIDERDRDAIVNYLSTIQLKRIRQLREQYLYRGELEVAGEPEVAESEWPATGRNTLRRFIPALILVMIFSLVAGYFWRYTHDRQKGEIERTFEDGVRKYRDKLNLK